MNHSIGLQNVVLITDGWASGFQLPASGWMAVFVPSLLLLAAIFL